MPDNKIHIPTLGEICHITRSNRRTLEIIIRSGNLEIKSPEYIPLSGIYEFINSRIDWIERKLSEQRQKLSEKLTIVEGSEIPFFGQPRILKYFPATRSRLELLDNEMHIFARQHTPEHLEQVFNRWLMASAREYMTTQTIKTARQLNVENRLQKVIFRKTRSKWGHCLNNGTIQYNWLVMMAPKPVVDYLIAHESSHLVHMNHSRQFWQTVAQVCPDYKELKNWLGHNGHRFWTH